MNDGPEFKVISNMDELPDHIKEVIAKVLGRSEPTRLSITVMQDLIKKATDDAWQALCRTSSFADATADEFFIQQKSLCVMLTAFTDQCCSKTHVTDEKMAEHILMHVTKSINNAVKLRKELKVGKGETIHDKATPSHLQDILDGRRTAADRS